MRKKWLKNEDLYLIKEYGESKKEQLIKNLNRSWISIRSRASRLGIKKINVNILGKDAKIWDEESVNYLKENYATTDKQIITSNLKRSWSSVQNKAFLLGLKRENLNCDILKLINESNESYYWLGFLIADGHFSKTNQIQINLAQKDITHLIKMTKYLEYSNEIKRPSVCFNYSKIKNWLDENLKITNNKTYNPCDLSKLSGDKLFSLAIGFIDGDGTINKKGGIVIKCHKSWVNNLNLIVSHLTNNDYKRAKINSENLARIQINKIQYLRQIKIKALVMKLPILTRKWDRIDENKLSKQEKYEKKILECQKLIEQGVSVKIISELLDISKNNVYQIKNKFGE